MVTQSIGDEHRRPVPTSLLQGLLYAVGAITIAAGLYFAALERFLLTAVVCFTGLLPAGLLAFVLQRRVPRLQGAALLERQRQSGGLILIVGIVTVIAGGILTLVSPGGLATVFLWMGPGTALGGGAIYGWARSELAQRET